MGPPSNPALHTTIAHGRPLRGLPVALACECEYVGRTDVMAKRAGPSVDSPPEDRLHQLDAAIAEVLGHLDAALSESAAQAGGGPVEKGLPAKSRTGSALSRIVASISNAPRKCDVEGSSGVDQAVLFARARSSLQTFAREAKAERQRAAHETANAAGWERNAKLSVHARDDDLAREALGRRAECVRLATWHARRADLLDAEFRLMTSALEGDPKTL